MRYRKTHHVIFLTIAAAAFTMYCLYTFGHSMYTDNTALLSTYKRWNIMTNEIDLKQNLDYKVELQKLNQAKVRQDDPRLIDIIRKHFIIPPSDEPYNLNNPDVLDHSMGQAPIVDNRLHFKENGFFIECGAYDGEHLSNTLFFEKYRNWEGLLIEADPVIFIRLKKTRRKAFIVNACLNTQPYPSVMTFNMADVWGRIANGKESLEWIKQHHRKKDEVEVQCFPLYSIMLAIKQLKIDLLSLDVEGDELSVLKTLPWNSVNITMMAVEYVHNTNKSSGLKSYLGQQGYEWVTEMVHPPDIIFKKKNT